MSNIFITTQPIVNNQNPLHDLEHWVNNTYLSTKYQSFVNFPLSEIFFIPFIIPNKIFDAILFVSPIAIQSFFKCYSLPTNNIFVIGKNSKQILLHELKNSSKKLNIIYNPKEENIQGLWQEIKHSNYKNFLIIKGNRGNNLIYRQMNNIGISTQIIQTYQKNYLTVSNEFINLVKSASNVGIYISSSDIYEVLYNNLYNFPHITLYVKHQKIIDKIKDKTPWQVVLIKNIR